MEKKVSLRDVAQRVGVSTALVSYVLNGKEKESRVGSEMAKRIRKVANDLNYQPNLIAKSLKMGSTKTIGLIVADISNPFFSSIARIIEDGAKKNGYVVIFGSSDESEEKQKDLINVFTNRLVDGFIIAPAAGTESQIKSLIKKGIPVVLLDRYFPGLPADSVHIDNVEITRKAVSQLILNGKRKIAMVTYNSQQSHMHDRVNGYKKALNENRIRFRNDRLIAINYQSIEKETKEKLKTLLQPLQIDALFFATNSLAVAGLREIMDLGIKVPKQLAVISFDETEVFDFFYSPLSYVRQPLSDFGLQAVSLMLERIKDKSRKTSDVIVDAKLIIRKSCGSKL